MNIKIENALISVFHKEKLQALLEVLAKQKINIYSTGGTYKFIKENNFEVAKVEDLTSYPSILGGRVKTLHPKVFGGILARRENESDAEELNKFEIPLFDLVIVDLYPFEATVKSTNDESTIIEKIDIGGIALIRAAAKNYKDVVIISSESDYEKLAEILTESNGATSIENRKHFAAKAFATSSHYDTQIFNYFNQTEKLEVYRESSNTKTQLRYGENPHQQAAFFGNLNEVLDQIHGKAISYNNLLDIDAALGIIEEFDQTTIAILKHNNSCGLASRNNLVECWKAALAGDPVSAFGGIIICNKEINAEVAEEINKLFFEIIIAPSYDANALEILKQKKNRIILIQKQNTGIKKLNRTSINGFLVQERDLSMEDESVWEFCTEKNPTEQEKKDLLFANKAVKHLKSNGIALVKNEQLVGMGCGQTSRIDALKQAITKAKKFELDLNGAVMASDAFFPFPDCVEVAKEAGVNAVIQPGGSIRDKDSIAYCNEHNLSMVLTGKRHFKH